MAASVTGLEIEAIAHATEDIEKVKEAILRVLPAEAREAVRLKVKELKGHHGNPIKLVRARIRDRALASAVFRHVVSGLPETDRLELVASLQRRLSGGSLYLRLDKQRAFLGQLRLCYTDPIWMKFSFSSSRVEDIRRALEEVGRGP